MARAGADGRMVIGVDGQGRALGTASGCASLAAPAGRAGTDGGCAAGHAARHLRQLHGHGCRTTASCPALERSHDRRCCRSVDVLSL